MEQIDSMTIGQIITGVLLGLVPVGLGLQKLYNSWKSNATEGSIISIVHEELERMGKQNTILATELNKLQLEIVTLNRELHKLTLENQRLHTEVVALTAEVARLQTVLKGEVK